MKVYFNEEIIVNKIKIADTFKKRLIGLIGRINYRMKVYY